ncbi:MAG: glycosyltransferase family A protein [Verrucomicrobiota bacterium]
MPFSSVSVIIPCFNHGAYLREAIESVLRQEVSATEVIVVDDGSTDSQTRRVLDELQSEPNLKVLSRENGGPAAARNTGIQAAAGPYLLCVDADDRLRPEFLSQTVPRLEADPEVGIVYGRAAYFGAKEGESSHSPFKFPEFLLEPSIFATALFRKADWEKVGGFREEMKFGWEDFEFWISLVEQGCKVAYVDEVLFDYRQHEGSRDVSFSASRERILEAFTTIYRFHSEIYGKNIRLLFEAHLERLDWRSLFASGGSAELRIFTDGKERVLVAPEPVPEEGDASVTFHWGSAGVGSEDLRFDPFDGIGEFLLRSIELLDGEGEDFRTLSPEDYTVSDPSFSVPLSPEEGGVGFFFLGGDPHMRISLRNTEELLNAHGLRMHFTVCRGAAVGTELLKRLGEAATEVNQTTEMARGLRLELSHVKAELESEISKRRAIQSSLSYRLTRPIAKLFEKKGSEGSSR